METYFDRIKNGTEEDVIDEIEKAIEWARSLTPAQWAAVKNDTRGGLRGVIRDILSNPIK